jgi:hypothetical protein
VPAKYDLEDVKKLVAEWLEGDDDKLWFTPRRKSYGAVGYVLSECDADAQETIGLGIMKLNEAGFRQQVYLSGRDAVADVYGLQDYRGYNWYVKFFVHDEENDRCVASVSFHPLDEEMKCESGQIFRVTYSGDRPWKNK